MTSKLTKHKFNRKLLEKNVPLELQETDQWVAWAMESRGSDQKPTKVPKDPRTLRNAKTTSPDTWGSFEEACAACENHPELDGIGFVFTDNDPYVGIDLDGVVDRETGVLNELANDFVSNIESYTELSRVAQVYTSLWRANYPKQAAAKAPSRCTREVDTLLSQEKPSAIHTVSQPVNNPCATSTKNISTPRTAT